MAGLLFVKLFVKMASVNLLIDWRLPKTGKVSEIFRGREFTAESETFSLLFYFYVTNVKFIRRITIVHYSLVLTSFLVRLVTSTFTLEQRRIAFTFSLKLWLSKAYTKGLTAELNNIIRLEKAYTA